ncbi:hypothetical protein AB5I41_01840 [Sphingomonas sp. MMS24-JH45]
MHHSAADGASCRDVKAGGALARRVERRHAHDPARPAAPVRPAAPAATPAPAQAPAADTTCAAVRVALPAGFVDWSNRQPLDAGAAPRNAPVLAIGRAADLSLHPLAHVQPVLAPGQATRERRRRRARDVPGGAAGHLPHRAGHAGLDRRGARGPAAGRDGARARAGVQRHPQDRRLPAADRMRCCKCRAAARLRCRS